MATFFLVCAAVGGILLIAGPALTVLGSEMLDNDYAHAGEGLQLFSVRALSAGLAFFGLAGLGLTRMGWALPLAGAAAAVVGATTMVGVAILMRTMLRFERDASRSIEHAIGKQGTVYIPVPASLEGVGKILVSVKGKTMELQAVTPEATALATGMAVVVVNVRDKDTVEVTLLPTIDGVS